MLHRLKRMDAAMERFLGSSEEGSEVLSEQSVSYTELPALEMSEGYKAYLERWNTYLFYKDTYERLNLIWKQIFLFTDSFGVSATADPAVLKSVNARVSDINSSVPDSAEDRQQIRFNVYLKCELFAVNVRFVHTDITRRRDGARRRFIEYTLLDKTSRRTDVWDRISKFNAKKMLYDSTHNPDLEYNKELEDKDAYFLVFDLLSNLQAVLRHNQLTDRMKVFNPILQQGKLPGPAIVRIREIWVQEAKNKVIHYLRGMLEMCRPGFTPAMSLDAVLRSNLTTEKGFNRPVGPDTLQWET